MCFADVCARYPTRMVGKMCKIVGAYNVVMFAAVMSLAYD